MFTKGDQVTYIPQHAEGDIHHKDVEFGFIMSLCDNGEDAFVRYFRNQTSIALRTMANSERTSLSTLKLFNHHEQRIVDDWIAKIDKDKASVIPPIRSDKISTAVTTRDDKKFTRLAIIVQKETTESVDVVDGQGKLLMRLNISNHNDSKRSIDVIGDPGHNGDHQAIAWLNGERVLDEVVFVPHICVTMSNE